MYDGLVAGNCDVGLIQVLVRDPDVDASIGGQLTVGVSCIGCGIPKLRYGQGRIVPICGSL